MSKRDKTRLVLLVCGGILFLGLMAFSLFWARYPVDGADKGETYITERSLTHGIERDRSGRLAAVTAPGGEKKAAGSDQAEPCPT